jgi:hypothetical protein
MATILRKENVMTKPMRGQHVPDTGKPSQANRSSPEDTTMTLTSRKALQSELTKSGLPELAKEIKACIAAGDEAQTREKKAKAEATQRFIAAGKLLIQAQDRAPNFKSFLQEHGISRSRAYELIKIAGGEVETVRAETAERKRRQRAQTKNGVRDIGHVTDTVSEPHTAVDAMTSMTAISETPEASAKAHKVAKAKTAASGVRSDAATDNATTHTASEVTSTAAAPSDAVSEVKRAIDRWFPHMDDAGRREIASYVAEWTLDAIPDFLKKAADGKSLSPPPSPHAEQAERPKAAADGIKRHALSITSMPPEWLSLQREIVNIANELNAMTPNISWVETWQAVGMDPTTIWHTIEGELRKKLLKYPNGVVNLQWFDEAICAAHLPNRNGRGVQRDAASNVQQGPRVRADAEGREWYTEVSYLKGVRLDPAKITPEQWVRIGERHHREDGAWLWGWPRPGLPGCPMPGAIQSLFRRSPAPEVTKGAKPPRVVGTDAAPESSNEALLEAEVAKPAKLDFDRFCAMISAMYGRYGLCPPFRLRSFAADLIASDIDPQFCLAVVDRHLKEHASSSQSGAGDRLLPYLNDLIRHEWNKHRGARRRVPRHDELARDLIEQELGIKQEQLAQPVNDLDDYTARSGRRVSGAAVWESHDY